MRASLKAIAFTACLLFTASSASAAWYDDYDAGIAAAKRNDWDTVITRMDAALRQKNSEGRERSYGNIFVVYRPYYYRGVAHFERGNFAAAKSDLNRTQGPGALPLGSVDSYLRKIEAATPPPTPTQAPPTPTPTPTPTRPPLTPTPTRATPTPLVVISPTRATPTPLVVISPTRATPTPDGTSARLAAEQARELLARAEAARVAADGRARTPQARQLLDNGTKQLQLARSLQQRARSAADWGRVSDAAEGARLQFEVIPAGDPQEEMKRRVRAALDSYYGGRYAEASAQLISLTRENPSNGFLWAFLGASRYSEYYIDGERNNAMRQASENAFRQARLNGMTVLSPEYFSPRIRRFFVDVR